MDQEESRYKTSDSEYNAVQVRKSILNAQEFTIYSAATANHCASGELVSEVPTRKAVSDGTYEPSLESIRFVASSSHTKDFPGAV